MFPHKRLDKFKLNLKKLRFAYVSDPKERAQV